MKINTKRFLSAMLLMAMLVGLLPMNILAQETADLDRPSGRATSYTDLTNTIKNLPQVANQRFDLTNCEDANNLKGGTYYIVKMDYNDTTALSTGHLLDPSQSILDDALLKAVDITVSNDSIVSGAYPDMAFTVDVDDSARPILTPVEGLLFDTAAIAETATEYPGELGFVEHTPIAYKAYYNSTYDGLLFVSYKNAPKVDSANHWYTIAYSSTAEAFVAAHNTVKKHDATNTFRFFRLADHVSELYKAIKAVEGYADGNSDGRYHAADYNTFYDLLTTCLNDYTTNNAVKTIAEQASLKTTLDANASALLAAASQLDLTMVSKESYIDIPVEIVDFRADGALFEWYRPHSKNFGFRTTAAGGEKTPTSLGSKADVFTGMTEPELIDGQLIYREATINYVAQSLKDGAAYDWSTNGEIPDANLEIYKKAASLTTMGSLAETIAKTDTKANGGYLTWANIATFYDLSYYILNNLWRPVQDGDYLDTTNAVSYNMIVPDRKRLRLFMDEETGLYTIDSANRMSYNGYYVYSASEPHPNDAMYDDAFFRPIDNLGYEASVDTTGDTDWGTQTAKTGHNSETMNFHFSMHVEGSFVYYRDKNLYFEFIGDDDVYFYINDQIVLDLGSSHTACGEGIYLNDIAAEFGLVDGNVYPFDMFYIERHTHASNLKFSTNIKLVEKTKTEKGMYAETSGDTNTVDSNTGMGKELMDDALVRDGDIIAYSFNIANTRDIPVYNVAFKDATLGTDISPTTATLSNTSLTGGVATDITDIELYYQCYDDESGEFCTDYPITKTIAEMTALIDAANTGASSFVGTQSYRVSISTADELKTMLKKGVPAYCKLLVYGFKRLAQDSVPEYTNTVNSTCYYNLKGTGAATTEDIAITGSASRRYRVTATPPAADVLEMVLDYGKAVEIPVSTVQGNIETDALTTVTGFAGIVTTGSHEAVLTYLNPASLLCASSGKTYEGKQGIFTRTDSGLTYQPTEFMDSIETVYLVYNLSATNSDYKYILVEVKLVPATSVYYETDFSDTAFSNLSNTGAYHFDTDNAFYADFTNTELDIARYKKSVYGGKNFDVSSNWAALPIDDGIPAYSTPRIENGTLSVDFLADNPNRNWIWVQANGNLHTGFCLNYHPHSSHVVQIRVKFHDLVATEGKKPYAGVYYFTGIDRWEGVAADFGDSSKEKLYSMSAHGFTDTEIEAFNNGEYVTITFDVKGLDSDTHTLLTNLRFQFGNVECKDSTVMGGFTLDYVYVGPKGSAPAADPLYFDFGGTIEDLNRYGTHNYLSQNFDVSSAWQSAAAGRLQSIAVNQDAATLDLTAAKSLTDTTPPTFAFATKLPLSYIPANAEVAQIRFKMENFVKGSWTDKGVVKNPDTTILLSYTVDSSNNWVDATATKAFSADYLSNGEYVTLEMDLKDVFKSAENVHTIRFYITGLESDPNSDPGVMTIDYIYIGSKADAPSMDEPEDYLYFDFKNSEVDQARYANDPTYGGKNYDISSNWSTNRSYSIAPSVDNATGTLKLGFANTIRNSMWYQSNSDNSSGFAMQYRPASDHYVKMRLKFNGIKVTSGKAPYIKLGYFIGTNRFEDQTDNVERIYYMDQHDFAENSVTSGEYVTLCFPVSGLDSTEHTKLTNLRLIVGEIESVSATELGTIDIDYIYIGKSADFDKVRLENNQVWQTVTDGTEASDNCQDHDVQSMGNALFFDFTNTPTDRIRYSSAQYGGESFDVSTAWTTRSNRINSFIVNPDSGSLEVALKDDQSPSFTVASGLSLNYDLANAEVFEIRFKMKNLEQYQTKTPFINLVFKGDVATSWSNACENNSFPVEYLSNEEYITIQMQRENFTDLFKSAQTLTAFDCYFAWLDTGTSGIVTIDYFYFGPKADAPSNITYGKDSSYEDDSKLSNGSSLFAEGRGIALMNSNKSINYSGASAFTESSFTFTGTGFDIISRTGTDQGQLRAVVYDNRGNCVKVAQVLNKSDLGTELMQIPVLSIEKLDYGTYYVKIFVAAPYDYGNDGNNDTYGGALDRGGEFHFDAIRIYNPINVAASTADATTAYRLYLKHGEADPNYTELRNTLITATNFNGGDSMPGAVYIDAKTDTDHLKNATPLVHYTEVGPNNEVYLSNGYAIAFKLSVTGKVPESIDISAKSANSTPAKLVTKITTSAPTAVPTATEIANGISIASATQQYYPLDIAQTAWQSSDSESYVYVTIYNADTGILSISDIKCAYDEAKTPASKSIRLYVDREMLDALNICYEHDYVYSDNGEHHIAQCANCDYRFTEEHVYTDGICICGGKEVHVSEALDFTMSITIGAQMNVGYSVMAEPLAKYESFYLEVSKVVAGGDRIVTVYNVEDFEASNDPESGEVLMYKAVYKGINAKEMGDEFTTTLYAVDADGKLYCGPTQTASIKSALLEKFGGENASDELKTMAIDMLNYGAAAQIRLNYNVENLVNADLTEEQKSFGTQEIPEAANHAAATGEGANVSTNITVASRVQLNLSCIYSEVTDPNAIKCVITDSEGKVLAELATTNKNNVMFTAIYENIGAKEMRDVINATFYEGDTAISKTVSWSVESYVAQVRAKTNATEDEIAMVNAMLIYGDSVAAYMSATGQ